MENLKIIGMIATMPLAIVNRFGGIVAGIWLVVVGDWAPLIQGLIFAFVGCFTLSFALMPSLAVSIMGIAAFERGRFGKFLSLPLLLIGGLMQYLAFAFYIFVVYKFVFDNHFSSPVWLVAVWAFSIASGTFGFMAQREARASGGAPDGATIFAVVAADILAAVWGFGIVWHWAASTFYGIALVWLVALAAIIAAVVFMGLLTNSRRVEGALLRSS